MAFSHQPNVFSVNKSSSSLIIRHHQSQHIHLIPSNDNLITSTTLSFSLDFRFAKSICKLDIKPVAPLLSKPRPRTNRTPMTNKAHQHKSTNMYTHAPIPDIAKQNKSRGQRGTCWPEQTTTTTPTAPNSQQPKQIKTELYSIFLFFLFCETKCCADDPLLLAAHFCS